jgi:hypothetical protein
MKNAYGNCEIQLEFVWKASTGQCRNAMDDNLEMHWNKDGEHKVLDWIQLFQVSWIGRIL